MTDWLARSKFFFVLNAKLWLYRGVDMGSGASFQPQADAYDNLAQFAVEGALSPSSQKAEKKDGPELKAVLEVRTPHARSAMCQVCSGRLVPIDPNSNMRYYTWHLDRTPLFNSITEPMY